MILLRRDKYVLEDVQKFKEMVQVASLLLALHVGSQLLACKCLYVRVMKALWIVINVSLQVLLLH